MKAGFWMAPEGEDAAMTILPIGGGLGAARKINLLATASGEELIRRCGRAAALLPQLAEALDTQRSAGRGRLFDITEFDPDDQELLGQVLGEGEVSGVAALPNGIVAQIQESVMAGLWRVRFTRDSGMVVGDYLEVGAAPQVIREACAATSASLSIGDPPEGTMNVMPLLAEIAERMNAHRDGGDPHVITFSLLPMTPADMSFLQATLGAGPVRLFSRGYGSCRVVATGARNVWSVQFFNAMDAIVLDTLEIGGVPAAACAAEDDFRDSAVRLREIEEAYFR